MSETPTRRVSSLTPTQKVGQRVSDRWWPMRQAAGKRPDGTWREMECWVDMHSGQDGSEKRIAYHDEGWNGEPPPLPSGDPGRAACWQPRSATYRENYLKIAWDT